MSTRFFIYSTLSTSQRYTVWNTAGPTGSHHTPKAHVLIRGGANVANKKMDTPCGVMTEVSEDDMEILKNDHTFLRHVQNGFITIRAEKVDPEVAVAADMKQADGSAPITPNDPRLQEQGGVKPMEEKPTMLDRVKGLVGLAG